MTSTTSTRVQLGRRASRSFPSSSVRLPARRQNGDGREILPVMSYLPGTIAALHIVNSLVSVIPFGEKVGVGVEAAIALCETIQVRRK
jgi:hypothetical protein